MDLVACLTTPESTHNHVKKLVEKGEWESVTIITDEQTSVSFPSNVKVIKVNFSLPVQEVINKLVFEFKNTFKNFEVHVNLVSGSGKEHMAILAALLKVGVGIRLSALTKEGVTEL